MNKTELMQFAEDKMLESKRQIDFKAGDTIAVDYKIIEGNKERVQTFQGVVIQINSQGVNETFTVRKISGNTGVERIIPINSPFIENIRVMKRGAVRRAKIFYLRKLRGKKARIKERRY